MSHPHHICRIGVASLEQQDHHQALQHSAAVSGRETPLHFATEDTPAVFSRNDSLSSLSCTDEPHIEQGKVSFLSQKSIFHFDDFLRLDPAVGIEFKSHLPRPQAIGRSESSGSSKSGRLSRPKTPNAENDADGESSDDDDDLLANCVNSGMPKSKSEPLDLKVVKRKKKKSSPDQRPNSKSPRNSRVIPGVRIAELKLLPTSKSKEEVAKEEEPKNHHKEMTLEFNNKPDAMAISDMWTDESPNVAFPPKPLVDNFCALDSTLTESKVLELEANKVAENVEQQTKQIQLLSLEEPPSLTSSLCSNISTIQPPSVMDSLISISERRGSNDLNLSPAKQIKVGSPRLTKLECKHTLSAKKGHVVPEMVRRALGVSGSSPLTGSFDEMSCSLSSCQSNLDNIQPPTIMDDMDNSILSIASISSEVAEPPDVMAEPSVADATALEDIVPPSAMEEVSGCMTTHTLVADPPPVESDGQTYTIQPDGGDHDQSTCQDITDVFDKESTLTLGSEHDADEAPELPRDSRHSTPASSRESTPRSRRKKMDDSPLKRMLAKSSTSSLKAREWDMERLKTYQARVPSLDESESFNDSSLTSGYRSGELIDSAAGTPRIPDDMSKTLTPTNVQDIMDSGSESSSKSAKSIKQRRSEEADRFKTHTITTSEFKEQEAKLLEAEAKLVVDVITERKATARSRSASADTLLDGDRSKSASIEILDDETIDSQQFDPGSCNSTLERRKLRGHNGATTIIDIDIEDQDVELPKPKGPRICKPIEDEESKGIRGRRRGLYSPAKRSTVPPAVAPKPVVAPKPKVIARMSSPPTQVRGTRAFNLRQGQDGVAAVVAEHVSQGRRTQLQLQRQFQVQSQVVVQSRQKPTSVGEARYVYQGRSDLRRRARGRH